VTAWLYSSSLVACWRRRITPAIFKPTTFEYMSSGENAEGRSENRVDAHPYQVAISCQIDAWKSSHPARLVTTSRRPYSCTRRASSGLRTMRRVAPSPAMGMTPPVAEWRAICEAR